MGAKIKIINAILFAILLVLLINLFFPLKNVTGNAIYTKQELENIKCKFTNQNESREIPIDNCCFELQKQILCKTTNDSMLKCSISEDSKTFYEVNIQAINYCEEEGYEIKAT